VAELIDQLDGRRAPDLIIHSSSSGGTQAGLVAGCRLFGLHTRVVGVSADEPAEGLSASVARLVEGIEAELDLPASRLAGEPPEVDDGFIGEGYGLPTPASREAAGLAAQSEAIFVDHSYTAKAMAALVAYARGSRLDACETVLFWHTGGQVALFA
jgi:1-aminocyclopropane-1-carboxylate deaminase/D-cysteine desulfhydrase-like pyridoxal-dependent ACC family enzyme